MGTNPPPKKGGHSLPIFGPYLLWSNGWMDHDATWYGGRPCLRQHCVTWDRAPPKEHSPHFQPMSILDERGRPWPRRHCVDVDPASPLKGVQPPIFGPYLLWSNGWMDHDATWYGGRPRPRRPCIRWIPLLSPPQRGYGPQFLAHVYCGQTVPHLSHC